ncbi:NifB/NifX family molybdenum-iron cluster-binding protein [Helicovermis profundi]|uniref:Dinitrogenase iron-molybdenum cofactor biosynthesis domain-containing protein n=1 Tax=Helicovermis profundi TaxID=3065157 RepID=A0AAU9E5D6_9FIRM|nr:hypothetical protein HLPR_08590 [Clostridia bacterium S502]
MLIACATDNGTEFCIRHFGDAIYYDIYEIDSNSIVFINRIENTTEEEKKHADPNKAKGILSILKKENINIAITKVFGPNIKRISKKLLPVISENILIEESLNELQKNYDLLLNILSKSNHSYFDLLSNKEVILNE